MSFLHEHIKYRRSHKIEEKLETFEENGPLSDVPVLWTDIKGEQSVIQEDCFDSHNESNSAVEPIDDENQYYVEKTAKDLTRKSIKRSIDESINFNRDKHEDEFFCNSVACSLRKMSRLHNMKAKVEIYKVLEKFVEMEEAQKTNT